MGTSALDRVVTSLRNFSRARGSEPALNQKPSTNPSSRTLATSFATTPSWSVCPLALSQSARSPAFQPQSANAFGHLGWNLHPFGGFVGLGTSPSMPFRAFLILG